ncbi:MAG: hypothetical protein ABEH86_05790 [Haloarcula sp.]
MTIVEAWQAVFNPEVIFNHQEWDAFLLGGEVPEMNKQNRANQPIEYPKSDFDQSEFQTYSVGDARTEGTHQFHPPRL